MWRFLLPIIPYTAPAPVLAGRSARPRRRSACGPGPSGLGWCHVGRGNRAVLPLRRSRNGGRCRRRDVPGGLWSGRPAESRCQPKGAPVDFGKASQATSILVGPQGETDDYVERRRGKLHGSAPGDLTLDLIHSGQASELLQRVDDVADDAVFRERGHDEGLSPRTYLLNGPTGGLRIWTGPGRPRASTRVATPKGGFEEPPGAFRAPAPALLPLTPSEGAGLGDRHGRLPPARA